MPELTDFLQARIADEENLARDAASEGTPHRTGWQLWTSKVDTTPSGERLGPRGSVEASPARVLAECEAKTKIIAIHTGAVNALAMVETADDGTPDAGLAIGLLKTTVLTAEGALKCLAEPYADHPDYNETWRP